MSEKEEERQAKFVGEASTAAASVGAETAPAIVERLSLAFRSTRAGTCDWDARTGSLTFSPEAYDIFGIDRDEPALTFDAWFERCVHVDDRARLTAEVNDAMSNGPDEFDITYRSVHPVRGTRWIQTLGHIIRDESGAVMRVLGFDIDVTDRRAHVEELARANAVIDAIFDTAPIGIGLWDRELRFARVNRRLAEINGLPPEAHIGKRPDEILPDIEKIEPLLARWRKILETGEPWLDVELTGETPAAPGVPRTWKENFFPVRMGDEVIGIGGIVEETTDRRAAERALRSSEQCLRQAAEAARLTYSVVDLAADRVTTGANFAEVMGYRMPDGAQVADAEVLFVSHVAAADRERIKAMSPGVLAETLPESKVEYRVVGDNGRERWIESVWSLDHGPDGRPVRVLSVHLDISERKQREEQVRLLMREVNHRSKNMLAVVQSLARQGARDPTSRKFVDDLSERLEALATSQDLIVRGEWRSVALIDLVRLQLDHLGILATRAAVSGEPVLLTPAAAQGIGMALHELATNAVKYGALTVPGGRVTLHWTTTNGEGGQRFVMTWTESGGPSVTEPNNFGFGHTVITRMAAHAVKGHVGLVFDQSGVRWSLDGPLSEVTCRPENDAATTRASYSFENE